MQGIVRDAVQSVTRQQQMWIDNDNIAATQKFKDFGCELVHLPPAVERAVIDTANAYYSDKALTGTPLYKAILESQQNFISQSTQQSSLNTPAPSAS